MVTFYMYEGLKRASGRANARIQIKAAIFCHHRANQAGLNYAMPRRRYVRN